ncbi:MAG: OmpH family outer membrane protein [Rhodothermales bacterium]|nr:OmpH family outer membrane protein [Rhodothermales bacterium]MBO6779805.1 OmpH family outer membrane protein [Rhodothermales bacterium]
MNARIRIFLVLLAGLVAVLPASAQMKIGYADPEVIITYMPEYQSIQQQLGREYQNSQESLQAMAQDFQERVERYQKQQPLLTPERRAERESELAQQQAELQQAAASEDEKLAQRQDELLAPLLEQVQNVIDEIAVEKGLHLVLRSPALLYVNEELVVNINLDIASKLGISLDEETASN